MNQIEKAQCLLKHCNFNSDNVVIADNLIIVSILNDNSIKDVYESIYRYLGKHSGFLYDITFMNLSFMIRFEDTIESYICADYKEFRLEEIPDNQLGTYSNQLKLS